MKIKNKELMKYLSLAFVCLVLAQAEVGGLSPFLFAFFFACLYVGLNEKIISAITLVGGLLASATLENLLVYITVVAVGLIMVYVHKFAKRKIHLATIFISEMLSFVTYIYYNSQNLKHLILFLLLALICLFVYITVLQVMLLRKNCFKLTLDESICFLFAIASLGVGLAAVNIYDFAISRFFLCLTLLICVSIGSPTLTYSIVLAFSLGCGLNNYSLICVAEFMILSMLANLFSMPNKFKIVFTVFTVTYGFCNLDINKL